MRNFAKILFSFVLVFSVTFVSYAADLNELQDKKSEIQS